MMAMSGSSSSSSPPLDLKAVSRRQKEEAEGLKYEYGGYLGVGPPALAHLVGRCLGFRGLCAEFVGRTDPGCLMHLRRWVELFDAFDEKKSPLRVEE